MAKTPREPILTRQAKIFCDLVLRGETHMDALAEAMPEHAGNTNKPARILSTKAARIYMEKMKTADKAETLSCRHAWLERLVNLMNQAEDSGEYGNAIKAAVELGKAHGHYAPTEVKLTGADAALAKLLGIHAAK